MKRTSLSLGIIAIIITSVFLVYKFRLGMHSNQTSKVTTKNEAQKDLVDVGPQLSIHLSSDKIGKMALTAIGQQQLCSVIGEEGNGLDESSLEITEIALAKQSKVEGECLKAIMERLDYELILKRELNPSTSRQESLQISLLKKYPAEVSELVRNVYGLGTENPDSNVLPLLYSLQMHTSCADIRSSRDLLRKRDNALHFSFDDAYSKLCK